MKKRLIALLGASVLCMAACGSGSESTGELSSEAVAETTTSAAAAAQAPDTQADEEPSEEAGEDEPANDEGEPADTSAATRPAMTLTTLTAGPITVTPTECRVDGAALEGPSGAESMAFAGERLFIANDAGVLAFSVSGPDCLLTLDTAMGSNGVMTEDDNLDSLSGNANGRLVASGVLGSMVYDTNEGFSYECDMTGYPSLSPDGATALSNFPGRDALEQWSLTDTNCDQTGEVTFDGMPDVKFAAYDGDGFLVGGSNAEEIVVVSRFQGGAAQWTAGSDDIGADDWWGWVHGMAPCGNFTCMIDTNTNALALIGADGTVAAAFEFEDLVGLRGWIEPIVVGPDGAVYVLHDEAVDVDENRTYFASVVRLDVTG